MSIPSLRNLCACLVTERPEIYGRKINSSHAEKVNDICKTCTGKELLPPSWQELKKRLFLVHATNVFPRDKRIKPGAYITLIDENKTVFETYRHTVHFALNGLVQPHGSSLAREYGNSWEEQKFAFVIPFKTKQLLQLFPADTFAVGDYELTSNAVCLTDRNNQNQAELMGWPKEQIVVREAGETLRDSINDWIEKHNGWSIYTIPGQTEIGLRACFRNGPYRSFDLALPYFYSSCLNQNSGAPSFGSCSNGTGFGSLFKQFDIGIFRKASQIYHYSNKNAILDIFEKEELEFYLQFVPKILAWEAFGEYLKTHLTNESYNEWLSWVYYSLQLMRLDLELRTRSGFYLAFEWKQGYSSEFLSWRESLFSEARATLPEEKRGLMDPQRILQKFEKLKSIVDKCSLLPIKEKITHFFCEGSQLRLLRNLPWERFLLHIPDMIPLSTGPKGTQESFKLCVQICYLVNKFFLTQEENSLLLIQDTLEAAKRQLTLPHPKDIFSFMALHHPRLHLFLIEILETIDTGSSLYPIAQKFKKHFGILRPLIDSLLEANRLKHMQPHWDIEELESSLTVSLEDWFLFLEAELEKSTTFMISKEEVLTFWRLHHPTEWNQLLDWLSRIPQNHSKVQEWRDDLKKAEKWHQKNLQEKKRFFEAFREGNLLKLI